MKRPKNRMLSDVKPIRSRRRLSKRHKHKRSSRRRVTESDQRSIMSYMRLKARQVALKNVCKTLID